MKNYSTEFKHGFIAPVLILIFAAIMAMISPAANADIVDDTRDCFPSCSTSKASETTLSDELKWLCSERGGKDC